MQYLSNNSTSIKEIITGLSELPDSEFEIAALQIFKGIMDYKNDEIELPEKEKEFFEKVLEVVDL